MQLRIGDRLGRPFTTAGGKATHARVKKVSQPDVTEIRSWGAHERVSVKRATAEEGKAMMRCVLSLALVVVLPVALSGCSRENAGERLTRECREVVDVGADPENTTDPAVATVKRTDMEAVIRSEQWATTPLRKAMQAELAELETSRGHTSDKYDAAWERLVNTGDERDAIWRAAFESDFPRRERIRNRMIRECVRKSETKEGAR
jgi:hypothetical protein